MTNTLTFHFTGAEPRRPCERASTTVTALITVVVLAAAAASVLRTALPRYHVTHQTASWQEARLAAEAGVDLALERLNKNVPEPSADTTDWVGWKTNATTAATGSSLARSNATDITGQGSPTSSSLFGTPPIYYDNIDVSTYSGMLASADIQMRAFYPGADPYKVNPWFQIRSMGTTAVPGPKRAAPDRMDGALRRLSLKAPMRGTLAANDVLTPTTIPFPNASRIVEVIARPIAPFAKAILTQGSLTLGGSTGWEVNSYDSDDPNKSGTGGTYPGDGDSKIQSNGDIATNSSVIDANLAPVLGTVSTNGGDDASTTAHENVLNAGNVDPNKIFSDYNEPLPPPPVPTPSSYRLNPDYTTEQAFAASGSSSSVYNYRITASDPPIHCIKVTGSGRINIFIDTDWDILSGTKAYVEIPPTVKATMYVKGNIAFANGQVNTTDASSKVPGNLVIYGVPDPNVDGSLPARTIGSGGSPIIAAAFYGPSYRADFRGTAEWAGSVACYSYTVGGGGSGGVHFDEALGAVGFIKRFEVSSYFEDSRQ